MLDLDLTPKAFVLDDLSAIVIILFRSNTGNLFYFGTLDYKLVCVPWIIYTVVISPT